MIQSKALEINLARTSIDVAIGPEYLILMEIMSDFYGLADGINTFLKELSHPYRNWQFIVKEARGYSLDYFHLIKKHPKGPDTARLFVKIFSDAIESAGDNEVKTDAADNLILFLQKIIREAGPGIESFIPVLNETFQRIEGYREEYFFLFLKSYYQLKKLAEGLLAASRDIAIDCRPMNTLLQKYFKKTYAYWLGEEDPQRWFEDEQGEAKSIEAVSAVFEKITHAYIRGWKKRLSEIAAADRMHTRETAMRLVECPGYHHFVDHYRNVPQQLYTVGRDFNRGYRWKLIFIFHVMNISGLSMIHEEMLRDINRTLTWLIGNEEERVLHQLIGKTFSILRERTSRFPATALSCVLNMGKAIYQTDDSELANSFIDSLMALGFQAPMVGGVGDDWQIKANNTHVQNIRTWLEIIELNPKWSFRLLSALIIHLSLSGVFIKDTDLFPRDITRLLNSDIAPVYNLAKQLARLLPVFFNDIGAEGDLRDISTQVDEISYRKDILIHFLRKQSHVESSNRIVQFMEATINFWKTRKKSLLKAFVPPMIYNQIRAEGEFVDGVHRAMLELAEKGVSLPGGLLDVDEGSLVQWLNDAPGVGEKDRERVRLITAFYKLLNQKYNLSFVAMDRYLAQLRAEAFPSLDRLKDALAETDLQQKILKLIDYLELLMHLIQSSQTYEIREDIYKKRHFTIDIPSMYGSYHEVKFDALGLTFRIESILNVLFEELVESVDLSLITKSTFFKIYDCLKLFNKALNMDGIASSEIEHQLDFLAHSLEVRGFTFTQYLDIFKGFAQAVKNIINDYFNNIHETNLDRILSTVPAGQIQPKYLPHGQAFEPDKLRHRVSEIFFRERITQSLGLQQLDLFISRILNTLFQQSKKLRKDNLQRLLLYDHQRATSGLDHQDNNVSGIIHLGNKGLNLVRLKKYGLPVPPGFIITTEVFRSLEVIESYPPAEQNLKEQIAYRISLLEKTTGKTFGQLENPLLLSVRSGSAISQPGMMDTFLNVGINEEIAAGFAERTGNAWFAWDNYRRFLQCYGMAYDLKRDDFDAIINGFKQKWGIELKRSFSGDQMKQTALAYKQFVRDAGVGIEESPFDQLHLIINKVFASWESDKAKAYRQIMGISDDWGTAVTVQAMVYGNLSPRSGTGVIFTHNPRWSGDALRLWGDFTLENQGEDVVSGLVNTLPISIYQQEVEMRDSDVILETNLPDFYGALKKWANYLIYEEGWGPQEMEFTFEKPTADSLYLLQTRDMAMRERKKALSFCLDESTGENLLSHGIGVSGGAMSGRIVFSLEEINRWRKSEPETSLILVRNDTVPDDILEIYAADGLLTARGGLTSHAAVVAHRLGKTCVVGCGNLTCQEAEKSCFFHNERLRSGDFISLDGQQGSVFKGRIPLKENRSAALNR